MLSMQTLVTYIEDPFNLAWEYLALAVNFNSKKRCMRSEQPRKLKSATQSSNGKKLRFSPSVSLPAARTSMISVRHCPLCALVFFFRVFKVVSVFSSR